MKANNKERLVTIRAPRNDAPGYMICFYEGRTQIGWHHSHTRNVVTVGKVVWNWVSHGNIPAANSILWNERRTQEQFKEGAD